MYISKSSAALNPLTITELACERPRGRSRTALRVFLYSSHLHIYILIRKKNQLAVRMRIINGTWSARYGTVHGALPLGNSSLLHVCIIILHCIYYAGGFALSDRY